VTKGKVAVHRSRFLVLAAVSLVPLAVPVAAQARKTACPEGAGCVWDQRDYEGRMAKVPSTGCIDAAIRSAVNASDQPIQFFVGAGCRGARAGTLPPGEESSQINAGSATGNCTDDPTDPCSSGLDPGPTPPGLSSGR